MNIEVHLPKELASFKEDLEFFVSLMVRKMHTNRHKGTGVDLCPIQMLRLAQAEINEALMATKHEGQFETAVECADVANFAFLSAMASLHMTRDDFKNKVSDAFTKEGLLPPNTYPPIGEGDKK